MQLRKPRHSKKRSEKAFSGVEKRSKRAGDSLFKFSNIAKGVFAGLGVRQFITFADDITLADNQLRNITANTEQFNFVQMELNRIAQETRQNVNNLTSVFAKFSRAGQEAGFSVRELLDFTENLTKSFKLEGNSVAEVNSVLGQLVQSFRKGNIDGEEFRALSEGSTLALQALSKQLRVNIGDLKDLGAQGKIAPRDLIEGLAGIGDQIDAEFATLGPTFAELGTKLGNLLAKGFRESGTQDVLDNFKKDISAGIDAIEFTFTDLGKKTFTQFELIEKIGVDAVGRILDKSKEIAEIKSKITVTTDASQINELTAKIKALQSSILGEAEGAGFFDKALFGTVGPLIRELTILTVALEEAKIAASTAAPTAATEVTRKPIVTFGSAEDKIIAQGSRRLTLLEDQAEAERQLLQAVDEDKISNAESSAILAGQKEIDRLNEQFQRTLERLETNQASLRNRPRKTNCRRTGAN